MSAQRILIVDDDPDMLALLTRLLQKAGYVAICAQDPVQAAMTALRVNPALVLLDIQMPAGGGLTVLRRLKMSSKTIAIPVVVLTANVTPEVEEAALAAGASRVLRKPCDGATLAAAIGSLVGGPA